MSVPSTFKVRGIDPKQILGLGQMETTVANVGSDPTTLWALEIPERALKYDGDAIEFEASGGVNAASAWNLLIMLRQFDSTVGFLVDSTPINDTGVGRAGSWYARGRFVRTGGDLQLVTGLLVVGPTATGKVVPLADGVGTANLDAACTFEVWGDGGSSNEVWLTSAKVDIRATGV